MIRRLLAILALVLAAQGTALAVEPGEILKDPEQEARAREVGKALRCVVCQNQSIDDSNAELARDMRVLVRERITAGDSDQEILDYMVSRYGDFVLLDPPFKTETLVLWIGPGVIALIGLVAVVGYYRRRKGEAGEADAEAAETVQAPLSDAEKKRLAALMEDENA